MNFKEALRKGGLRNWNGDLGDSAKWLPKKFGDVCSHETTIAHIRRLLDGDFSRPKLNETTSHFRERMQKVEDFMHSPAFEGSGSGGLIGLAKELRPRREELARRKGQRLPK